MKLNDIIEVEIKDYDHEGRGFLVYDNKPLYIDKVLPGEKVKAKVSYINSTYAKADLIEVINKSDKRNYDLCPYYDRCGGCNIMHLNYEEQLKFKHDMVKNTFKKIAGFDVKVNDVVRNPQIFNYRNKIIVPFKKINGKVVSGFYEAKSHNLIEQDNCLIENENARIIINALKDEFEKRNVSIYDETSHTGLVRNVMIRVASSGDVMLVLIVLKDNPIFNIILNKIYNEFENVKSVYLNVNDKKTNVILNHTGFKRLYGDEYIIEVINNLKFKVHPNSFLQVNHAQAEAMYNKALSYIDDNNLNIIDAYCGIGSITLNLASKALHVYGIEIIPQAIDNANENKDLNNIKNATFICGKCEEEIEKLSNLENINTVVVDPPRKGCDEKFLDTLVKMKIKNIIYISCLTQSLARDCKYLSLYGYEVKEVTPYDLFSHSYHTENVCYITLKDHK